MNSLGPIRSSKKSRFKLLLAIVLASSAGFAVIRPFFTVKTKPLPVQQISPPSKRAGSNGIVIDPSGKTSNLLEEIGQLQSLYEQTEPGNPLRARLQFAMGETYVKYGKVDEAMECFFQVLESSPHEKRSHFYLGRLFLAKGDTLNAVRYWKRYLELDPSSYMRDSLRTFLQAY